MKRILLLLLISAPICAMQPDKKIEVSTSNYITTGIVAYNTTKPLEVASMVVRQSFSPFLFVPVTTIVADMVAKEIYKRAELKQQNNK